MSVRSGPPRTVRFGSDGVLEGGSGVPSLTPTGVTRVDASDPTLRHYHPLMAIQLTFRFDPRLTRVALPSTPTPGAEIKSAAIGPIPLLVPQGETSDSVFSRLILPIKSDIKLPNHRSAGEWSASFLFRDLPLHPEMVKQASCAIGIVSVPAKAWAEVQTGRRALTSVFQGMNLFTLANSDGLVEATTIWGPLDEYKLSIDGEGAVVTISGRDPVGILANTPVLSTTIDALNLDDTIDNVVRQILRTHPTANDLASCVVAAPPAAWPKGVVPRVTWEGSDPPDRLKPKKKKKRRTASSRAPQKASSDLKMWDLITQYCFLVGAIPRWRGRYLEIFPARGLYDQATLAGRDKTWPTPFAGGATRFSDGTELRMRRLIVNEDVTDVEVTRRFTPPAAQAIRVVSHCAGLGRGRAKVLTAIYPEEKDLPTFPQEQKLDIAPDGKHAQTQYLDVPIPNINNIEQLRTIAKALFEERQRGEFRGTATVRQLASQLGSYRDPDMLRLKPGDAIELAYARNGRPGTHAPAVGALSENASMSRAELVEHFQKTLGRDDASRRLSEALASTVADDVLQIDNRYYVQNVRISGDPNMGVEVVFDFITYPNAEKLEEKPETPRKSLGRRTYFATDGMECVEVKASSLSQVPDGNADPGALMSSEEQSQSRFAWYPKTRKQNCNVPGMRVIRMSEVPK